jgi:hypothetical protein
MLRKLGAALRRFLSGRYGMDTLGKVLFALGLVTMALGAFLWRGFLGLSYGILIYTLFRAYSRNIPARQKENRCLLQLFAPLRDKKHRYFKCPQCRQAVRVPKGKGLVNITCPKCRRKFQKRS